MEIYLIEFTIIFGRQFFYDNIIIIDGITFIKRVWHFHSYTYLNSMRRKHFRNRLYWDIMQIYCYVQNYYVYMTYA